MCRGSFNHVVTGQYKDVYMGKAIAEKLLVDGKSIGKVIGFQLTHSEEGSKATIRYVHDGKERILSCELEAVSFGS